LTLFFPQLTGFLPILLRKQAASKQTLAQRTFFGGFRWKGRPYDHSLIKQDLDRLLFSLKVQNPRFLLLAQDLKEIGQTEILQRSG
jgi:hypothetical protein